MSIGCIALCERGEAARLHRRRAARHGRIEPRAGSVRRDVRAASRLAALPHAGQHRSGADQGDRAGGRSRQDAVHRLLQIRQHAGAQYFPRLFLRPRRRGARQGQGRRALRRRDRSRLVAGEDAPKQLGFAHIFYGVPSIGGRYSVLSKFGLVPAAAMGLDVKRLLETAQPMERACGADVPPAENPGVQLGVAMGVAATRFGRDKVTIIASPGIADLGAWLEQLLAESTGKQGRGLIPLADEPLDDARWLRQRPLLRLSGAGRTARSVAAPGGGGAGAGRPSGRAHQREGYLAHRPGILPLGDRRPRSPARSSASIRSISRMSRRARSRRAR